MILPIATSSTDRDVVAHYVRARATFHAMELETTDLDLGTAICSPQFARTHDANQLVLTRVPSNVDVATGWDQVVNHFSQCGATCWKVTFSPDAKPAERLPLEALLIEHGWYQRITSVFVLQKAIVQVSSVSTVISARAARQKYANFAHDVANAAPPQLGDLAILRLDDPRWEVLVLLDQGQIVARVGILSLGEIGLIENVHVLGSHRRRGFARSVIQHAIDLCARAQFKHVLLGCEPTNAPAIALYDAMGFARVGESVSWFDPRTCSLAD